MSAFYGYGHERVNASLYASTGYRVDHVPYDNTYIDELTPAVVNGGVITYDHNGISAIKMACPADYAQYIDYCVIYKVSRSGSALESSGTPADPDNYYQQSDILSGGEIVYSYYYVTGYTPLNAGVIEFTLMLDSWTTLRRLGATLASAGGMLTRCPVYDAQVYNTLQEPYTPQYPYVYDVTALATEEQNSYAYAETLSDDSMLSHPETMTIVLSPYILPHTSSQASSSTIKSERTSSDSGTTINYPASDSVQYATRFSVDGKSFSYPGIRAYPGNNQQVMRRISMLFGADISNAVMDAYVISGGVNFSDYGSSAANSLAGIHSTLTYAVKGTAYSETDKSTYLNRWVTLFCPSSGESQSFPLYDLELTSAGAVTIDYWIDPMPGGGITMRMRRKGETASEVAIGLPGAVKSKEWQKATIALTLGGRGVEQGQMWKSAELGIEREVAAAQIAATNAQYDFAAGNGYLLKNAGNEYGLQSLTAQINAQTALHNNTLAQNTLLQVQNATNTGFSAASQLSSLDPTKLISGKISAAGTIVSGAENAVGIGLQRNAENINFSGQQAQNQIMYGQLSDQGEYNTSLLRAQGAAASAVANASMEKINLQSAKLSKCPETTVMGYEHTGILQALPTQFYVIETRMDDRDVEGLKKSLEMFGESVYLDPSEADTHINSTAASGKWNFVKIAGVGQDFLSDGLTVTNIPAWLKQGFCDQLEAGIWIYKK